MDKKHHRKSIRLREYDYSQGGAYFITILSKNHQCIFGEILDGKIRLNKLGEIIQEQWLMLPDRYEEIELDNFIIMPNHIHGIIIIVGAIHELPIQNKIIEKMDIIQRRKMLLPKIVGYFKMNTSKQINILRNTVGLPFWHRNYYEHIIRSDKEMDRIREYINNNPYMWEYDRENPNSDNFNLDHDTYWKGIYMQGQITI
jgi:REP element-mobilizing transposase RayT